MVAQGEKLLLLVRRSGKESKQVAEEMGYTPQYLAKLFKKENLPSAAKAKAIEIFELPEDYFDSNENGAPASDYSSENEKLKAEVERLKKIVAEKEARILKLIDMAYDKRKAESKES